MGSRSPEVREAARITSSGLKPTVILNPDVFDLAL